MLDEPYCLVKADSNICIYTCHSRRGCVKTLLFLKNHKALTFTSQGFAMSKSCCTFRPKIFNYGKVTLSFLYHQPNGSFSATNR